MKKMVLSLCGLLSLFAASAQLSFGANANYTMYKGDFQKSTPGVQLRGSYSFYDKMAGVASFTYGMPIKEASIVTVADNGGNTIDVASEVKVAFKTINLLGHYSFVGDAETTGRLYGMAGAGLVLVNYKEDITGSYDKNTYTQPTNLMEKGSENGFTLNVGLGGQYKLGAPSLFAEAAVALPANQVGGQYVENVIPAHFIFNFGVKFDLGGGE